MSVLRVHGTTALAWRRREDHQAWFRGDSAAAMACLQPYPDALMAAYPVSTRVNSPKNDEPDLIEPDS